MKLQPADNPAYRSVRIRKIIDEVPGVKTFILDAEDFSYKAGQFLTFVFKGLHGEERRSYSFSSSPDLGEPSAITLKRIMNGRYSRPFIDSAAVGDVLAVTEAGGQFVLPDNIDDYRQVFFFAAGIGITPVYSLVKTLLHKHRRTEVILIYSNPSVSQTVFYKELLELRSLFPEQLRLELLFSSSPDLSKARLSKWLLPQLLRTYDLDDKSEQLFYTCGPFAYMRMVILGLEEAGYTQDQVRKEQFDTSQPAPKLAPHDKAAHEVAVLLNGMEYKFMVQYPETILQAAKNRGILLPYSCETGRCSSCVMHCTEGEVWMSYNEVLTDKEVREGKVLTCVGYPVGGDVTLRL